MTTREIESVFGVAELGVRPNIMSYDCKTFSEASKEVRSWIVDQPDVKEESLTDWFLRDISKKVNNVYYTGFNRMTEARVTGADWEWWFLFNKGSYRMRIQAKKLFPASDNYAALARSNKYGLQIDKLISDSQTVNALPLYAMYSAAAYTPICPSGNNSEGVYIAGARTVKTKLLSNGIRKVTDVDALLTALPLSCLVCCPMVAGSHRGMDSFLEKYFRAETGLDEDDAKTPNSQQQRGFYNQLPPFMKSFIELRGKLPDWWENEFAMEVETTKKLVAYDLRERV